MGALLTPEIAGEFVAAAHRVAAAGLLRCSSGNLSCRLDAAHLAVSASGSWLAELRAEQVAVVTVAEGETVNGVRASVETAMHRAVYRARPERSVVLHCQSPCATALACAEPGSVDFNVIVEVPYYVGPVAHVPFVMPGSAELAAAVGTAVHGHDLLLLRNHGQVVCGNSYHDVTQKAAFFELACEILLSGAPAQPLPADVVAALQGGTAYRPG